MHQQLRHSCIIYFQNKCVKLELRQDRGTLPGADPLMVVYLNGGGETSSDMVNSTFRFKIMFQFEYNQVQFKYNPILLWDITYVLCLFLQGVLEWV